VDVLAKTIYERLNLISFLTAGEDEVRAWTIRKGLNARSAAGKIHSDIERGFIRAEVVSFADFKEAGSMAKAKELGKFRLEGKEYIVQDGDIVNFRFNV
jgi:ribosome-binding ATPase YchF (GTP1/OBG family)